MRSPNTQLQRIERVLAMKRVNVPTLAVALLQVSAFVRSLQSQRSSPGKRAENDDRCCPEIVHPPDFLPRQSSVIAPYSGWRANAAIIVNWGNCTVQRGFGYAVEWGDGSAPVLALEDRLAAFQEVHQYEHWNRGYLVTAHYCWVGPGTEPRWPFPDNSCCTSYARVVMASYDPYALT